MSQIHRMSKAFCDYDATRVRELSRTFSYDEIRVARHKASTFDGRWDYTEQLDLIDAWAVARVLTSDSAWGIGRKHIINEFGDVTAFFRDLLGNTEPIDELRENPSVINFMISYLHESQDPSFPTILRAYLYGFPETLDLTIDANTDLLVSHNALQTAADHDSIDAFVLKTLLEAGSLVDIANDNGDTALMLCTQRVSRNSAVKLSYLLDYGANIDNFNICFQNCLHMAVLSENIDAICAILANRDTRLAAARQTKKRCREGDGTWQDPLHMKDEVHETPMMTVHRKKMSCKTRMQIVELLVEAGAVADVDVDRESRVAVARKTGGVVPSFGLANCQIIDDITVFISIHKPTYSMDVTVSLDMLHMSVDKGCSTLPHSSMADFDMKLLFMLCANQRFSCDGDIDWVDFDLHFNTDATGGNTKIVGCNDGGAFKAAIRFPKGPCPLYFWTDGFDFDTNICFEWHITMNKCYTFAHHAALIRCPTIRSQLMSIARPLCNPLIKCKDGCTALETLQQTLHGIHTRWDTRRLIGSMRRDHDYILTYIHRDAVTTSSGSVAKRLKKKANSTMSPFWRLPDDVCRHILSYL